MSDSLTILVADDNQVNRMVAVALLQKAGHSVTAADGGGEAVEIASRGGFDVVLMDIRMPGMDGATAARAIRSLPDAAAARVPIIALTASPFQEELDACREAGMNGCLFKPFDVTLFAVAYGEARAGAPWRVQGQGEAGGMVDSEHLNELACDLPPELFAASLDACRRSMEQSISELEAALAGRDRLSIANVAHKLRGTAGTYGFRGLHRLAGDTELQARDIAQPSLDETVAEVCAQARACLTLLSGFMAARG
jgi:CheY-like chemotaxis protein/HPt (histidine-containing phosphotransfer) domain-containing protein